MSDTHWSTLSPEERNATVAEVLAPPVHTRPRVDMKAYNERLRRAGIIRLALLSQVDLVLAGVAQRRKDEEQGQTLLF